MDKPSNQNEPMVGFYDLESYTTNRRMYTTDILTALEATTQLLDETISDARDLNQLQGLAIASRIFAGMLADRYTGEVVVRKRKREPRKPLGTRKPKAKASVVTLIRSLAAGAERESGQGATNG